MTQATQEQQVRKGQPVTGGAAIDRSDKPGSIGLLMLVAGTIVGAAIALGFLANEWAQPLILAFLALLSVIGVFCLFALSIGLIQFSGRSGRNDLTRTIVDEADDGVIVTEADNRIIYANRAYQSLSGASTVADIRPVERLFAGGSDVSEVVYRLALAAREGRSQTDEIRLSPPLTGKGDAGWYRVSVSMTTRADGKTATLWRVRDITRERIGQENVFQELQQAIDFLDHAPAGFMSIDPDGSVPYLNATLAGWLDYDLAKVGSGGLLLKDIAPLNAVALVSAISGKPGEVRTEVVDVDLRRRNGQSVPVRLHHEVAFGQDGAPGASRTLVLNRTPGEAGADAGTAAEARLARFFNNTPMAIATVGADGQIVRSNAAFARLSVGIPATGLRNLIRDADWAALQPALSAAGSGSADIKPLDVSIVGEGDRSARLFLAPVFDGEGGEEKAIVYALETTSERKLKENIDQAQKMQAVGQLAGGIAHDFNNVLQVIINASDFLLASHKPTDPSFQDIMQIKQNGLRAASLVRQLLAFSRRQTLRPQVLEYGDVLSDLSLMLKRVVGDTIGLDVRHGRDLWPIKADVGQLEQVIVNLAVNARDAMKPGGKLTLRTRNVTEAESRSFSYASMPKGDYVLLEVEDTGSGIPPELLDKIFEPFFTTKDVGKGTGLGLSMVYGIVKQTGGFVFAESVVGQGTTFRIFLPRHVATAEDEAAEAKAKIAAAAPTAAVDHTGAGTILLVEDEDAVRALNARMLISRGYTVIEADSGVAALRELEAHGRDVDLVVSDVVMPEMDGPTLLGELRKRNPKTRFVFVSGYAEEAFKKNLPEGESFHFLPKPFTMKQLVETVKAAMA
jgi:two-component system, cell cycle sensor histidine kinase and response regulator CckA